MRTVKANRGLYWPDDLPEARIDPEWGRWDFTRPSWCPWWIVLAHKETGEVLAVESPCESYGHLGYCARSRVRQELLKLQYRFDQAGAVWWYTVTHTREGKERERNRLKAARSYTAKRLGEEVAYVTMRRGTVTDVFATHDLGGRTHTAYRLTPTEALRIAAERSLRQPGLSTRRPVNYSEAWKASKKHDDEEESEWMRVGGGPTLEHIAKAIVRTNSVVAERTGVRADRVGDLMPGLPDEEVVGIMKAELERRELAP